MAVAVLVGLAAGALFTLTSPERYRSETTVYVSAQTTGVDPSAAYNGTLLSQEKVKSYVELTTDSRLVQDVAQRLGGGRDAPWVTEHLTAMSPTETAIIRLTAVDDSPEGATALAAAGADSMIGLITDLERPLNADGVPPVVSRLVRPATFSPAPVSPSPWRDATVGLLAGLALGVAGVVARRSLDRSVRTPHALAQAASVPVLGTVTRPRAPARAAHLADTDRSSAGAEEYRRIRVGLQFVGGADTLRVLMVTSARHREGTSVVAANLGLALAEAGHRVLLVAADLRRPAVATDLLGDDDGTGLSLVLAGVAEPGSAVRSAGGLEVLPPGPVPPNPGELLAGARTGEVLARLRERYDHVIVDAPPVLTLADAAVLAGHVDGTVLVARQGRTPATDVAAAADSLRVGPAPVVGAVLTTSPALDRPAGRTRRPATPTEGARAVEDHDARPEGGDATAAAGMPAPESSTRSR